jgi:hypothetical protein
MSAHHAAEHSGFMPSGRLEGLRTRALQAAGGGFGVWLLLALIPYTRQQTLAAYLTAYVYMLGLSVGCLGFLMLHYLVGGRWGFVVRRPVEAAAANIPAMAALFLPLIVFSGALYPWLDPENVKSSEVLLKKEGYLNLPFWTVRSVLYFAVWAGLAYVLRRNSMAQDETADPAPTVRNQTISAPGLVVAFLAVTFAAIDWMMSIEPTWYSTIYGAMVMIGWALSAMSLIVLVSSLLSDQKPLSEVADAEGFHDLGNLLLAFTMLWAYMSFSQYLIIWMGDLSEDNWWYLKRSYGLWRPVCGVLIVFHFFAPFFCLLGRSNKRDAGRIKWVAAWLLALHLLNDAWLILPAFPRQWVGLIALAPAVAGLGGVWLYLFLGRLTGRPLLPKHDPMLAEVLAHAHHGGEH